MISPFYTILRKPTNIIYKSLKTKFYVACTWIPIYDGFSTAEISLLGYLQVLDYLQVLSTIIIKHF